MKLVCPARSGPDRLLLSKQSGDGSCGGSGVKDINFKELNTLIDYLTSTEAGLRDIFREAAAKEEEIRSTAASLRERHVMESLGRIPVDELRNSKAGIRVSALEAAGYRDFADLARADRRTLLGVNGIGEKQAAAISAAITAFRNRIAADTVIRLDPDALSPEEVRLILAAASYLESREIRRDTGPAAEELGTRLGNILPRIGVRNRLKWFFTGRKRKEAQLEALEELDALAASPVFRLAANLLQQYRELPVLSEADAAADFRGNSAAYYAVLEKIAGNVSAPSAGSGIPAELAAAVDALKLDLSGFRGELRGYQEFGVKYILSQKRVLLGDDMGLGKTIQTIAAMTHLSAGRVKSHFLVVCPAGVLVNWVREIRRFSVIPAYLLHGEGMEEAFAAWYDGGGAAVTNYESMGKIAGRLEGNIALPLLVIDEAHYIKNPNAMRSRLVRGLDDESESILLLTGTPIENRVGEMCSLIDFIRPDMAGEVRSAAALSRTDEFREMLAPVYLRRKREDVLHELPPVEEKEEWCAMTEADRRAYAEQILKKNFMAARRIGFLQDDTGSSSKAARLLELCMEAEAAGRKTIVYSFFRETIRKAGILLKDRCAGTITGSTPAGDRQAVIDRFGDAPAGSVLLCQIQAGGTGLNIQAASVIVLCEPQVKPSLENQAIARAWRMGQLQSVEVHRLLCEDSVDEAVMERLGEKQQEFDSYAEESSMADAADGFIDSEWINAFLEREHSRYLPVPVTLA